MATYTKFNQFTRDLIAGVHNFDTNTIKLMLTNSAPLATNTIKSNLTEITAGNGYTAGGPTVTVVASTATGTAKVTATDVVITAAGGSIGPFRYVAIYNDTPTSPVDPLIGFYDYGSSITLADTETFTVDFDGTNGLFTLA